MYTHKEDTRRVDKSGNTIGDSTGQPNNRAWYKRRLARGERHAARALLRDVANGTVNADDVGDMPRSMCPDLHRELGYSRPI